MNAYQQVQGSGIVWPDRNVGLLNQRFQSGSGWPTRQQLASVVAGLETQIAGFSAQHDVLLDEVRRRYVLPTDSSVITFLNEHRELPTILLEAAPHLAECFGPQAVFTLRAPTDDSGSQTLYSIAIWPGSLGEVRKALEKFDDTWWIRNSQEASGRLTFTYELV